MSSTQAFPNSALKPAFALCIVIAMLLAFASLLTGSTPGSLFFTMPVI